jgi:hypothetical protein
MSLVYFLYFRLGYDEVRFIKKYDKFYKTAFNLNKLGYKLNQNKLQRLLLYNLI